MNLYNYNYIYSLYKCVYYTGRYVGVTLHMHRYMSTYAKIRVT